MSAGDKNIYLQPGQRNYPVRAGGDFIFLKDAPRPVRVMIDGQPIIMRPGSKQRIARKEPDRQAFDDFQVDNLNDDLPLQATFVVGQGDYDEQIISGNIRAESLVMTALGPKPDSRYTIDVIVQPGKLATQSLTQGDIVGEKNTPLPDVTGADHMFNGEDGLIALRDQSEGPLYLFDWDLNFIKTATGLSVPSGTAAGDFLYHPTLGYLLLGGNYSSTLNKIYDARTLDVVEELTPSNGGKLYSFAYSPAADVFAFHDLTENLIRIYSGDFSSELTTIPHSVGSDNAVRYDLVNNKFFSYGNSGTLKVVDPFDYSVEDYTVSYPLYDATNERIVVRQNFAVGMSSDDATRIRKIAAVDFTTKPTFEVYAGQFEGLKKQTKIQTTAKVTVAEKTNGVELSGEVIKNLLEAYFLQKVETGYLDSVYHFDMGKGSRGNHQNTQTTGSRTFSLEGVKDNFEVFAPTKVRLTIDSNMPLGATLV